MHARDKAFEASMPVPPLLAPPWLGNTMRIYCVIIFILNAITVFSKAFNFLVIMITTWPWDWKMFGVGAKYSLLELAFGLVWCRIGMGLWRIERNAVYALCIFSLFSIFFAVYLVESKDWALAWTVFFVLTMIHAPIIACAYRQWKFFK